MRCSLLVAVALPLVRALPQRPAGSAGTFDGNTNSVEMTGAVEEVDEILRNLLESHSQMMADLSGKTGTGVEVQISSTPKVTQNVDLENGDSNDLGPSNPPAGPVPPTLDNSIEPTGGPQPPTGVGKRPTAGPATPQEPAGNKDGQSPDSNSTSGNSASNYIGIINDWRNKTKISGLQTPLIQDTKLEEFARQASAQSTPSSLQHTQNSNAQVINSPEEFKKVFIGGWICEIPSLAEKAGKKCDQAYYYTSTGHAEILSDPKYKYVCALEGEVWTCDLSIGDPGSQSPGGVPFGGFLPRGRSILQGF